MKNPFSTFLKMKSLLFFCLVFFLSADKLAAQNPCDNDIDPPIAVCNDALFVSLTATGIGLIEPEDINESSYDACGVASLQIKRAGDGACDSDNLPDDYADLVEVCCADVGQSFTLQLKVTDSAGNFNICWGVVFVEDKIKPVCVAPANVTVSCGEYDPTFQTYGTASFTDNCGIDTTYTQVNLGGFNDVCQQGQITRTFYSEDAAGQKTSCAQTITVTDSNDFFIRFPDDMNLQTADPNGNYGTPEYDNISCQLTAENYSDQIFTAQPDCQFKVERTWTIINWCNFDPNASCVYLPNPAGSAGTVYSAPSTPAPWQPTYPTFWNTDNNCFEYKQIIKIGFHGGRKISGTVFRDTSANCQLDTSEQGVATMPVKIRSLESDVVYETTTSATGTYEQFVYSTDTLWEVSLGASGNFSVLGCDNEFEVNLSQNPTPLVNLPIQLEQYCPILSVDISAPIVRRCFESNYYAAYSNLSGLLVEDVHLEVQLDDEQVLNSSTPAAISLGNGLYKFELGDLAGGAAGSVLMKVLTTCDADLGETKCVEARIFPDTICEGGKPWAGANLEVTGFCDGDSVRFFIQNTGKLAMPNVQDYIVVEDVLMYRSSKFQLQSGETMTLDPLPADGTTWQISTLQVAGHPFPGVVAAGIEGCGGLNQMGLLSMFRLENASPFVSNDCQSVVGSFDPNDKQATPQGYGNQHFIRENTDLEYRIRFQNTGTDTAFRVVILDTLSQNLEAISVRPGASSHDYDFTLLDGGVLRFTFDNIFLPDSNVNEAASHGFVNFSVKQKLDLPIGSRINNRAAIYFDFNEPVITNETFHEIGQEFISVGTDDGAKPDVFLKIYPQPASGAVFFELPRGMAGGRLTLFDGLGAVVLARDFADSTFRLENSGLRSGIYFFKMTTSSGRSFSGKVVFE